MEICENQHEALQDFVRLNEEWISHYFELEAIDHDLARNPKKVIDDGGYIFSITENDEIVGVCALFFEEAGVYELARMAVSPGHQGKGYANVLMEAVLQKLESLRAKSVFLFSNTKLTAALSLYRKFGFQTTLERPHPIYSRANIAMERIMHQHSELRETGL